MTHLYKIKDKNGRVVTFKPNIPQLKHLAERMSHRYNRILKARQFGFTTLYCIDLLDEALWVPGMACAILGHEREAVDMIFEIVRRAFINLPEEIKPKVKTDTTRMLRFTERYDGTPLDSSIYVALKLRSGTVQKLHITEIAYVKDTQELAAGSKQAVPLTGSISEETTANGFNEFYDSFMERWQRPSGEFDYKAFFYPWVSNPDYSLPGQLPPEARSKTENELVEKYQLTDGQLLWRRWKMDELKRSQNGLGLTGEQLFKQEYPITPLEAFQSGAGHVFDPEKLEANTPVEPLNYEQMVAKVREYWSDNAQAGEQEQKVKSLQQKGVEFWDMAIPGRKYVIGVDPSDGQGADYGVIDVWDDEALAQVAQFRGKLRPDELAELTAELGYYFNEAFVGVENNMLSTILFLVKIYSRYYFTTKIDEKTFKKTKHIGWSTNIKTRDVMIDDFNISFDDGVLIIRSRYTLGEMKTFVKKETGKREHADGKNDDCLFAGFIAIQMRKFNRPTARVFENKPF